MQPLKTLSCNLICLCKDISILTVCGRSTGDSLILPSVNSISALLRSLQESSQWELALGFVVRAFGTCLQYSVSNFMNASLSEKVEFWEQIPSFWMNTDTETVPGKGIWSLYFPIWLRSKEIGIRQNSEALAGHRLGPGRCSGPLHTLRARSSQRPWDSPLCGRGNLQPGGEAGPRGSGCSQPVFLAWAQTSHHVQTLSAVCSVAPVTIIITWGHRGRILEDKLPVDNLLLGLASGNHVHFY